MRENIIKRACELGEYIAKTNATVRDAAAVYGISKSTVHKDVSERLKYIDSSLFDKVKEVLENNLQQRHIRGGQATKRKWRLRRRKVR